MATILSIETATNACSAALTHQGMITSRFEIAPRKHSLLILTMIRDVMEKASISFNNLDAIAIGCGPGSFMGVRLAIGVGQGLAYAACCPIIAVSTLQCLAQNAFELYKYETILAGLDARMNEVYWGVYRLNSQTAYVEPIIHDQLSPPMQIVIDQTCFAAGNAWSIFPTVIENDKVIAKDTDLYPTAKSLLGVAIEKYKRNDVMKPTEIAPHYCRNQVATIPKRMQKS